MTDEDAVTELEALPLGWEPLTDFIGEGEWAELRILYHDLRACGRRVRIVRDRDGGRSIWEQIDGFWSGGDL